MTDLRVLNVPGSSRPAGGDVSNAFAPAIAFREAGDYAMAESWLSEHLVAQPDDARALAHLAHIQMLRKRDAAAHATLVRAEAIAPDDALILRNRARLALRAQKIGVAASAVARALAADPADPENRLVQAVVLGAQGEGERALQAVDALLKERPDFAEALANRALLHLRGRNTAAAMADAHRALELKPHLSQPWRLLASMHAQAMRTEEAFSALRRYCELEPEDAAALADFGELLRQRDLTEEAVKVLSHAVEIAPNLVAAWVSYGIALQQAKRVDDAAMAYEKALALKPDLAEVHNNLGTALKEQGKLDEAVICYRNALYLKPDYAGAHNNLGIVLKEQGKLDEAVMCFCKALDLKPDYAEAYNNRGNTLRDLKRFEEALASYDEAIALTPDIAEAYNNRGNALNDLKRYDEALASYDEAIALKPNYAEAYTNRGNTLRDLKRFDEALASCDKAIALKHDYAEAYNNRGNALNDLKRFDESLASYDTAIALKPDIAEAYNNRGNTLRDLKRFDEALASYDKASALKPDIAETYHNRGNTLRDLKRFDEAVASYDKALALKPDLACAEGDRLRAKMRLCDWSNFDAECTHLISSMRNGTITLPFVLLGISSSSDEQLQCARLYSKIRYFPSDKPIWKGERYDHSRIRIAYLSADFRNHAISYLLAGVFEQHDRQHFETIAISFGPSNPNEMLTRLKGAFDKFIDVKDRSDIDVARLLRTLEVDIAIDLMGFTRDSRTGIFSMRAAPIQVNYLGYPGTMGADYIDYLIADPTSIPESHHAHYTEKIAYLPNSYQGNDSKRFIAEKVFTRAEMGLAQKGCVFCCFNSNYKITPDVFDRWTRILKRVEGSVLWLLEGNADAASNLRKEAGARGINPERLVFAKHLSLADHLARHRVADLFLDTLPYNAHTTASDALWAGLPVLTQIGETFAGRVAASLLTAIGIPELITSSPQAYEDLAIELATNPDKLADFKRKLADNRLTRPLFDTELFTRHIEAAYTAMYERYQAGLLPDDIYVQ